MPPEGLDKADFYRQKFGQKMVDRIVPHMTQVYREYGYSYSLGGKTGSTLTSHRLAEWVKEEYGIEKQNELMMEMFEGYFCKEKYLNDEEELVNWAKKAGLPEEEAREVVREQGRYVLNVEALVHEAKEMRVTGVPYFVFHPIDKCESGEEAGADSRKNSRKPIGISGAQPPEVFLDILEELGLNRPDDAD